MQNLRLSLTAFVVIASLSLIGGNAFAQERLCSDSGECFTVPEGFEVRLVPVDTPLRITVERSVRTIKPRTGSDTPQAKGCTPRGELSLGGAPCAED